MQTTSLNTPQTIRLESSWKKVLSDEFQQDYMKNLRAFLATEIKNKKIIYPKPPEYFAALDHTPLEKVKVVILGQDPYHGPNQAHGLCFSVRQGVPAPPSLKNIFKEIHQDLKLPIPNHGCLTSWADQGVLLLNSVLTVQEGEAASHRNRGWELFTDRIIRILNEQSRALVFLLWGSYAQKKGEFIDRNKHCVLEAVHPSPLSAHRGFLGCGHFSKANHFLEKQGSKPIDWSLKSL
jgi:uracil-DNA glycosylase